MKSAASYLLAVCVSIVLLLLTPAGCAPNVPDNAVAADSNDFAIYFVDVDNVFWQDVYSLENSDLSELKLEGKPWLTLDDIEYYDSSSYYIYLTDRAFTLDTDPAKSFVMPFVVVAGGERCYLGFFLSPFSSWLPLGPYIYYPALQADDVIAIGNHILGDKIDMRNDLRIKEAFSKAGKLDPGLRVILKEAHVVSRAEVVTINYSFTITNEGDSPKYVPDPDKMGSHLFHYYTNGLYLLRVENPPESVWASHKPAISPEPISTWDMNWYTRLGSHESLERTVVFSGYPDINTGVYQGHFTFSGPSMIPRSGRTRADGLVWMGEVSSNTIEVRIED